MRFLFYASEGAITPLKIKEWKANGALCSLGGGELPGPCPVVTCATVALGFTAGPGAVGLPSKRPFAAHHTLRGLQHGETLLQNAGLLLPAALPRGSVAIPLHPRCSLPAVSTAWRPELQ